MRYLGYTLLFCLIALALAIAGALHLALENQPLISRTVEFTPAQIERAKRIVEKNDPRTMKPGVLRTLSLSQEDLDLVLNYLASRYAKASTRITLRPGTAAISASFELPRNPFRRFLNVTALLHETAALPRFDYLKIGRLPVPRRLAD